MARLHFGGAEWLDRFADNLSVNGTVTADATTPHDGGAGCLDFGSGAANWVSIATANTDGGAALGTTGVDYYQRIWVRFGANPGATTRILAAWNNASSADRVPVDLSTAGKIVCPDGTTLSSVLATATWHCIELKYHVISVSSTSWEVRVNGSSIGTGTLTGLTNAPDRIRWGNVNGAAHATTLRIDDYATNNGSGGAQNSWPGTLERIRVCLPTSDNAVGTDIKLGNGAATSGAAWDALNNKPPTGAATATGKITDSVATITNPTADADLNLQSYTTAGAPSGATITAVRAMAAIANGGSGVTSANGGIKQLSNPADAAETTLTTVNAGTYPTNWAILTSPIQTAPSVTLGTSPVLRVGKRNANTQAFNVAALGVMFGYEFDPGAMIGTASAAGSASGTVTGAAALVGTASGAGSASGTVRGAAALTGTASGAASASGVLSGPSGAMIGTGSAAGSGAGTLVLGVALQGSASAAASGAGSITSNVHMLGVAAAIADAWGFVELGLPTRITGTFTDRWASGLHVGAARPELRVEVRPGRFNRRYAPWYDAGFPIDAVIGDSDPSHPWQAFWEPTAPYVEVPSVRSIELNKTLDEKGIATAVITVDNIAYLAETGGQHSIHRGYMAPLRGYVAAGRTQLVDERGDPVTENEWFGKLDRKIQITVHEAYGDQEVKTFTGLIDDVDTTSNPAVIAITARSFGQVLSDEEFFGWNIDQALRDPVIFIDKDEADSIVKGGFNPAASTEDDPYFADLVNDGDSDTYWRSASHTGAGNTEWVEIRVSEGRHEDFWLGTEYPDLDVYVSIFAKSLANGDPPTRDDGSGPVALTPDAWVDTGLGTVPGTFGGEAYVRFISHSNADVQIRDLEDTPVSYVLGDDSIIRVSCRNLYDLGVEGFRAAVRSMYSRKRTLVATAGATKWIRVGDISDIVKVVLRWAGFKEWEVESTGARLGKRLVANRGMKYMDLIDAIKDGVGFTFFVGDPTSADESIGVPVFRKSHVVATGITPTITVTDGSDPADGLPHLLTAVDVKETDEPLAYIIRTRGRTAKTGDTLGGDTTKRIMYVYRPPWSGLQSAGVIRHVIHTDELYKSADDVRFAAWYLALEEALESVAVGVELAAFPGIDVDDIFVLQDLGTGLTTRLQVRERRSTNQAGQDAAWTMSLSGAITDTPDVQAIVALIEASARDNA